MSYHRSQLLPGVTGVTVHQSDVVPDEEVVLRAHVVPRGVGAAVRGLEVREARPGHQLQDVGPGAGVQPPRQVGLHRHHADVHLEHRKHVQLTTDYF